MTEFIIRVPENNKGEVLINFLRQIDFVEIDEATESFLFEKGLRQSFSDLREGKTSSWKNKKVRLKHA